MSGGGTTQAAQAHLAAHPVYTAAALSRLLRVSERRVRRWVRKGWLKAEREQLEGRHRGHYWSIKREDVEEFARERPHLALYQARIEEMS